MKKCIILSRVSTSHQDLIQQTNSLITKAKLHGYTDDDIIIIEDKESAIKLSEDERNGLNELKDYISKGNIESVFIWEITRISRQLPMLYSIRDYLQQNKVQLYCTTPEFTLFNQDWSISDVSNMVFAMFAVMAENEMRVKKERFARGKARAVELGKAIHLPMFGYRVRSDKYIEPDPINSKIIIELFEAYVNEEITIRQLAERYIANGTFNNSISTLTQRISSWLSSENFIGKKPYPAIISKSLFERAHKKAQYNKDKIRKGKFAKTDEIFLCKNLVYMMGTNYKLGTTGKEDKKYKKTGKSTHLPKSMPSINKNQLDPLVLELSINIDKKFQDKERIKAQLMAQEKELQRCKLVCVNKMKAARDKIDKVEERLIEGNLSENKATELSNKYKKEYESEHEKFKQYEESIRNIITQVTNLYEQKDLDYSLLTEIEKYDLVHKHIKRIDLLRISPLKIRINIEDKYSNYYIYEYHTRSTDLDYGCKLIFEGKELM